MAQGSHNLMNNLRLRTKLLFSLVLATAGLSCATLLVVRDSGEKHARQEVVAGAHTSLLTFDVLLRQHQKALAQKADLLATSASLAGDGEDVDATQGFADTLESDGSDLVAVADASDKIVVLHSSESSFRAAEAREMLRRSLDKGATSDWWYVGGSLYQVALQQIGHQSGTMIVGREIDYHAVHDMGRISAGQVVFTYDRNVVASTFGPVEEQEAGRKLQNASASGQIEIGEDRFFADSMELNSGSGPGRAPDCPEILQRGYCFPHGPEPSPTRRLVFWPSSSAAGIVFLISDAFTRPLAESARRIPRT